MVLNLFSGAELNSRRNKHRHRNVSLSSSRADVNSQRSQRSDARSAAGTGNAVVRVDGAAETFGSTLCVDNAEDRILFNNCVAQVQRNLKSHADSPSTLHILASYYTKTEPFVEGRPFCVSLSYATFLFHMQMARISVTEVELYVQLITSVLSLISEDDQLHHPFVQQVLRDHVFGLPSPTCRGAAHCVVLLPPQQYRAFATMTTALVSLDVVPLSVVYQFHDRLETYCESASPLVANRALALLVQTVGEVRMDEQITALQYVLKTKPAKVNVDFLLACYERLKRAVMDPAHGPTFGRALSIHCSELFLRFRSPVRRDYVERFLYPSLCHSDMSGFLAIPATRKHLQRELLSQCTPDMGTMNPFYMCLCALLQPCFDNEREGALETVELIHCRMPHAAYFMSTLAIDAHMAVPMFAKVMISLARGAGMAMTGHDSPDEVTASLNENHTSVYNVLFLLREVVRSCAVTASRRATDMLKALRVAVAPKTIDALGKLSSEAFEAAGDITLDPQLLCAELAMVLHQDHVAEAMDSAVEYFRDVTSKCPHCAAPRSTSLLCPVNGTVHVAGQSSAGRVLSTLSECAGSKAVEDTVIRYLRDPALQMESAVHYLIFHIIANGGQHRNALFTAVEPYVRSTLLALVSADRSGVRGLVGSTHKANVLMLHVKLVTLLTSSIDPSYLQSILKVFLELKLRNNHDALALWYMGNMLLRNCRGNLELLPTDPHENNYCIAYPACAPMSATTADNAQLVLLLLHRAHSFSPEMNKLVGCCVCKLIQDFNMQAPNICSALLSPFGFLPVGLESLNMFALPVGAGSTFWNFVLQQMRGSAPARTAFMATLAKSIARRFRVASPVHGLAPYGVEPTGHLFAIMVYEAMKRNPPLSRVLLYMVSHWMKQSDHTPGKFACLLYACVQLITVVLDRAEGPAAVELEAETPQDRQHFEDAAQKAAKVLKSQLPRIDRLMPTARKENAEFFHLLRRLHRRARRAVAAASGEILVGEKDGEESQSDEFVDTAAADGAAGVHRGGQGGVEDAAYAMQELQNAADDSVFDDYADHGEGGAADDDDAAAFQPPSSLQPQVLPDRVAGDDRAAAPARMHPLSSGITSILRTPAHAERKTVDREAAPSELQPVADVLTQREGRSDQGKGYGAHDVDGDASEVDHKDQGTTDEGLSQHSMSQTRSRSRGVQTEVALTRATAPERILQRNVGTSPLQLDPSAPSQLRERGDDPRVSSRLPVGSPGNSETAAAFSNPSSSSLHQRQRSNTQPPLAQQQQQKLDRFVENGDSTPRPRGSIWHEPDLAQYVDGDATPIDDYTDVPRLQATTTCDGVVLPSGMVLEYLRTHQGMDSLQHELNQFDQQFMMQQVAAYVAHNGGYVGSAHGPVSELQDGVSTVQSVTVEGRANNYGRPHTDPAALAPSRTVRTELLVIGSAASGSKTPVSRGATHSAAPQPGNEGDVVDGEHPIRAVSGPPEGDAVERADLGDHGKRRRVEVPTTVDGEASGDVLPPPVSPANAFRGRNFFLHQRTRQEVDTTLQDIHFLQNQQQARRSALAVAQRVGEADQLGQAEGISRGSPHHDGPSASSNHMQTGEGASPATPYGQVVLPTWVVEQHNDTALQELRQVMGAHNPNDVRLSLRGGKNRRVRGNRGDGGHTVEWWAQMNSTAMLNPPTDPQYSMELF